MDTQLNNFFGRQLPLFPETEPVEVTPEEEEAFKELERKRQVGGDHYLKAIQPWDIIRAWELNFWEGNLLKYVLRHQYKAGKEDLEKARHYLDYMIDNYEELYVSK